MKLVILLLPFLSISCTVTNSKGNVAFGGKGAAKGKDWAVVWDNEASFRDGAVAAGVIGGSIASVVTTKAVEATKVATDANRSAEVINASNNAARLGSEEIAAGVEIAKIPK